MTREIERARGIRENTKHNTLFPLFLIHSPLSYLLPERLPSNFHNNPWTKVASPAPSLPSTPLVCKLAIYCHRGKLLFQGLRLSLRQIKCQAFASFSCHSAACCMPRFNCMFDAVKLNLFNGLRHLSLATSKSNRNYNRSSQSGLINVVWPRGVCAMREREIRYQENCLIWFRFCFDILLMNHATRTHKSQATQSHSHFKQLAR